MENKGLRKWKEMPEGGINRLRNDSESSVDIPFWENGKCARAQSKIETKEKETVCMVQRKEGKYYWSAFCGLVLILEINMRVKLIMWIYHNNRGFCYCIHLR